MGDGQMKRWLRWALLVGAVGLATPGVAQGVAITEGRDTAEFSVGGLTYEISRNQNTANQLVGRFSLTSRPCPEFCIQPMIAARGIETLGELEVIAFLEGPVSAGSGLLIDTRAPDAFASGSIPGAVNVPREVLSLDNAYIAQVLEALGRQPNGSRFTFTNAMELTLYGNGPWADEATRAIRDLVSVGYPAERLRYYRGGMQGWMSLGLTVADTRSGG